MQITPISTGMSAQNYYSKKADVNFSSAKNILLATATMATLSGGAVKGQAAQEILPKTAKEITSEVYKQKMLHFDVQNIHPTSNSERKIKKHNNSEDETKKMTTYFDFDKQEIVGTYEPPKRCKNIKRNKDYNFNIDTDKKRK